MLKMQRLRKKNTKTDEKDTKVEEKKEEKPEALSQEEPGHVHHYVRNPVSIDDYYHIRDGAKIAYEQYPYHYVYDGKTGLTKETVTEKKNKTVANNATTDANKNTTKPTDEKKLNEKLTESFAQGE